MGEDETAIRVLLAAEEISVSKRERVTGRVKVDTRTEQRTEQIDIELSQQDIEIERVAIDRQIESAPAIRHEGDVTIIPVLEERAVVERQLFLVEEIRIRRVTRIGRHQEEIVLRSERADIRRLPPDEPSPGKGSGAPQWRDQNAE